MHPPFGLEAELLLVSGSPIRLALRVIRVIMLSFRQLSCLIVLPGYLIILVTLVACPHRWLILPHDPACTISHQRQLINLIKRLVEVPTVCVPLRRMYEQSIINIVLVLKLTL